MKTINFLLALVFASSLAQASNHYQVDESVSTISFATIKKQYIVEPAVINKVSGQIDHQGNLSLSANISELSTGVDIRDQRLNAMFFKSDLFPTVDVKAAIPADILKADKLIQQRTLSATVTLLGNSKDLEFVVNIVKAGDTLTVSTAKPVTISAAAFNIAADSVNAISTLMGGIGISDSVPVSFSLVLAK